MSTIEKSQNVVKFHPALSLKQQCNFLTIHRSGVYYNPEGESYFILKFFEKIIFF